MIHRISTSQVINPHTEINFRFHNTVSEAEFPQVHDFYEFSLMRKGRMAMTVGHATCTVTSGALILLRPGDVHSKKDLGGSQFINLAFPTRIVQDLFHYLGQEEELDWLLKTDTPLHVQLSPGEALLLQSRMESLLLLPSEEPRHVRAELRCLLLNCIATWFIPLARKQSAPACPRWFSALLEGLENPANLSRGMPYLVEASQRSPEHLIRTFQKYLSMTPNTYINAKRLNYATNLLLHSDHSILDIAYESGFQSESTFFHNFQKEYGVSPGKFRKQHCR